MMGHFRYYRLRGVALAVLGAALFAWSAALADGSPLPSPTSAPAELSREQLNPAGQARRPRRAPTDIFSAPAQEECRLPDDAKLKFNFHGLVIDPPGRAGLGADELQAAFADLKGQDITPRQICDLRDRIALRLFRRGILARVLIPQQHIDDGIVHLKVIEARIDSVRYDTAPGQKPIGPAQAKVEAILNHLRGLAPFDLNTAQRYLLLANDIPGMRASATLVHSSQAEGCETDPDKCAGALDLVVALSRAPIDGVGEIQNLNSSTLGPWNAIARIDFNSFTALGEGTSLIGYTTLGNTSQEVVQVIESARLGNAGLYAQASFAYGRSAPIGVLKPLDLRGDSYVGTFEVDDPVVRLKRLNLTLAAGFDIVRQSTVFPGGSALSDDSLTVLWARASGQLEERDFAAPALGGDVGLSSVMTLEVRKGLHILGASPSGALALSRPQGQSDAEVVRGKGDVTLRFLPFNGDGPLTFSARWEGQWASDPLLAYEEQPLGNLSIGRGFDPDTATGDRAIAAEFKGGAGPFPVLPGLKIGPYGFYDIGYAVSLEPGTQDITLQSAGGGLEILISPPPHAYVRDIRADLVFAVPLTKALPFAAAKPPTEVLFQITASF